MKLTSMIIWVTLSMVTQNNYMYKAYPKLTLLLPILSITGSSKHELVKGLLIFSASFIQNIDLEDNSSFLLMP